MMRSFSRLLLPLATIARVLSSRPPRSPAVSLLALAMILTVGSRARAQDAPPRIGPFVVDVRATFPKFKQQDAQLADSRGLDPSELPGAGIGLDAAAHLYFLTWKAVTVGAGVQFTLARSHTPPPATPDGPRSVTERFMAIAPQLSLNFGSGDGWSYLSGGVGPSIWSIVPEGEASSPADQERLKTVNYGGGARWFMKRRLAFTFDVRFYAIDPGTPQLGHAGSPRTTMLIVGAGISLK
jgi:hypothetical protein